MNFKKTLLIPAAISAFAVAAPAHAETLVFDFVGGERSFNFTLEQGQTPDSSRPFFGASEISYNNVAGTFTGVSGSATTASRISFATGTILAPLNVNAPGFGFGNFGSSSDFFDGSRTNPMFTLGSFNLFQVNTGAGTGGGTLTISQVQAAVPEPATWAMMILGFGIIGFGLRRRKVSLRTSVNFA